MTSEFNPYQAWLGVSSPQQPPDYYDLLGLPVYCNDAARIAQAAAERRAIVLAYLDGPYAAAANKLLGEIYVAEHFLKDERQKSEYDRRLKGALESVAQHTSEPAAAASAEFSPAMSPDDFLPPAAAPQAAVVAPAAAPRHATAPTVSIPAAAFVPTGQPAAARHAVPLGRIVAPPVAPPVATYAPPAGPSFAAPIATIPVASIPAPQAPVAVIPIAAVPQEVFQAATNTETASAEMSSAEFDAALPPAAAPQAFVAAAGAMPTAWDAPLTEQAAAPLARLVPIAASPVGDAPMAAAPVAAAVAAIPVAAVPVQAATAQASPAPLSPAATPAIASEKRRAGSKRQTPIYIAAGVPAALVVIVGLAILWGTGAGPFADTPDGDVAKNSNESPGGAPAVPTPDEPENNTSSDAAGESSNQSEPPLAAPGGGTKNPPENDAGTTITDPPRPEPSETDPPVTDPPTTDPPATDPPTTDPPATDPPTTDPPTPQPEELSQADQERVAWHLNAARYHFAQRDLEEAKKQIAAAEQIDTVGTTHNDILRIRTLGFYLEEFWKAAKSQVDGTPLNNTMKLPGKNGNLIEIILVEKYADGLLVKQAGALRNYKYASMPSGLAYGLADIWLNNEANSNAILGAFLCANPTSDKDEARDKWASAAAAGPMDVKANIELLMPELEITYPDELGEPPMVATTDPPSDPTNPDPETPDPKTEPKPGGDGKYPALSGAELKDAEAAFQQKYEKQLAAAPFDADKAELARTLLEDAAAQGVEPSSQFVLVDQARQMAAAGGEFELALEAADALAAKFAIDIEETKVDILAEAVKKADTPEANAELTKLGIQLAENFALAGRYDQALRAARWAKTTAGKAKDTELLKAANELYTQVEEEKKNAG